MHRGGIGIDSGKSGGGGMGRNGYRRDRGSPGGTATSWPDRGGFMDRGSGGGDPPTSKGSYAPPQTQAQPSPSTSSQAGLGDLETRLGGVQHDFKQALHKISEKENEKFDLIFAILSELQGRQAQLEESVRSLKAQYSSVQMTGAGQMPSSGGTGPSSGMGQQSASQPQQQNQQQSQFASCHSTGQPNYGQQVNSQMTGQPFQGVMQPDGTQAMFTPVQQVVVVQSPTAAGMQYAMPNQMAMMPTPMNQMPQQMAMQFVSQGTSQDMTNFVGGQDATGAGCAQAQVPVRQASPCNASGNTSWGSEAQRQSNLGNSDAGLQHTGATPDTTTTVSHQGGQAEVTTPE